MHKVNCDVVEPFLRLLVLAVCGCATNPNTPGFELVDRPLERPRPYPEPTETVDLFVQLLRREAFEDARELLAPGVDLVVRPVAPGTGYSVLLRKTGTGRCRSIGWIAEGQLTGGIPLDEPTQSDIARKRRWSTLRQPIVHGVSLKIEGGLISMEHDHGQIRGD